MPDKPMPDRPINAAPTFQEIIFRLKQYWSDRGCIIQEPFDVEVGAGTMCPETFLRVLGPEPYRTAYVQPAGDLPTDVMGTIPIACTSTCSFR